MTIVSAKVLHSNNKIFNHYNNNKMRPKIKTKQIFLVEMSKFLIKGKNNNHFYKM